VAIWFAIRNPFSSNGKTPHYGNWKGVLLMAVDSLISQIEAIGNAAGSIWKYLDEQGPVTFTKLARDLDLPRDLVMQGVGWLAREGKIEIQGGTRSKQISLA
jgi:hypothetical protein